MKLTYDIGRFAMASGHLGLILWFCRAGPGRRARQLIAAVGRMALTNYLAQSILCALIFLSFGLGLYGRYNGWQLYVIVGLIWLLQIAWSSWWLRYFRFGPFEWLWRSLTYGQIQPMRKTVADASG